MVGKAANQFQSSLLFPGCEWTGQQEQMVCMMFLKGSHYKLQVHTDTSSWFTNRKYQCALTFHWKSEESNLHFYFLAWCQRPDTNNNQPWWLQTLAPWWPCSTGQSRMWGYSDTACHMLLPCILWLHAVMTRKDHLHSYLSLSFGTLLHNFTVWSICSCVNFSN